MRTVLFALLLLVAARQTPPADDAAARAETARIVSLASRWTLQFEQGLSGLLFRERYLQKTVGAAPTTQGTISHITQQRELLLEANVFLLRASPAGEFVLFRDVYVKNGVPVTDHTKRLEELLTDGSAKAVEQARRLTDASAAHNVGHVNRNINIPTMGLRYLEAGTVSRVQFTRKGADTIDGLPTAIVDFEEVGIPTLVRGLNDSNVPARGRYWIDPESGAVVRAHIEFTGTEVEGSLDIEMTRHEKAAAWVPKKMTEVWRVKGQRITGLAQYDRFQRLNVATDELIKK